MGYNCAQEFCNNTSEDKYLLLSNHLEEIYCIIYLFGNLCNVGFLAKPLSIGSVLGAAKGKPHLATSAIRQSIYLDCSIRISKTFAI